MAGYVRPGTAGNISTGSIIDANDLNNEFNSLVTAFSASVGHTHGGGAGEGAPITTIGPAQDFIASAEHLRPITNNTHDLGSSNFKWRNIYGDGSDITDLNASELTSGTVPNARISGNYTGFGTITASGIVTGNRFESAPGGSASSPIFGFTGVGSGAGMHMLSSGEVLSLVFNSGPKLNITSSTISATGGAVFTGNGSGLIDLNASNLSSGIVPNGRISGNYTGFGNIGASGSLAVAGGSFNVTSSGHMNSVGNITSTTGAFGSSSGSVLLRPQGGGSATNQTTIASNGNMTVQGSVTGTSFIGNINATSLNQGTVPSGRLSGSYTGITGTGALNAGSITSGFGNINIGSANFTGNGSGITNLNMNNASTGTLALTRGGTGSGTASGARSNLGLGSMATRDTGTAGSEHRTNTQMDARYHITGTNTLPAGDLPTNADAVNWVRDRIVSMAVGSLGSYATFRVESSERPVDQGNTRTGSSLTYGHGSGSGSSGASPLGTWRCMGATGSADNGTTFLRIA